MSSTFVQVIHFNLHGQQTNWVMRMSPPSTEKGSLGFSRTDDLQPPPFTAFPPKCKGLYQLTGPKVTKCRVAKVPRILI